MSIVTTPPPHTPPPHLLVLFVTYFFYFLYVEEIVDLGKFTSDGAGASLLWEPIMCGAGGNRKLRACVCIAAGGWRWSCLLF